MSNSRENGAGTTTGTAGTALDFLQSVYRNPLEPHSVRMKAATVAIEYELPRLAVTATINGGDFAERLTRAVVRSSRVMKTIDHQPTTSTATSVPDRRLRRV